MPDFYPAVRKAQTMDQVLEKRCMKERLRHFLRDRMKQTGAGARLTWKKAGAPNLAHMQALGQSLLGSLPITLADFVVARRPRALQEGERRYLPDELADDRALQEGERRRLHGQRRLAR